MKILFCIDSAVVYDHCVSGAEMLRRKLDAQIVVMSVDGRKHLDATTRAYEVFEYGSLVRPETGFVRVWPEDIQPAEVASPRDMWRFIRPIPNAARRFERVMLRNPA